MNKEALGHLFLRLGLGGVFTIFGVDKFFHPAAWAAYIPQWFSSMLPVDVSVFIYSLGTFEAVVGLLILIGLFTRFASVLAALLMFGIITSLGYSEITVRDGGLFLLALGIAVLGAGDWSFDSKYLKRTKR